jgi:hypothetical protein
MFRNGIWLRQHTEAKCKRQPAHPNAKWAILRKTFVLAPPVPKLVDLKRFIAILRVNFR